MGTELEKLVGLDPDEENNREKIARLLVNIGQGKDREKCAERIARYLDLIDDQVVNLAYELVELKSLREQDGKRITLLEQALRGAGEKIKGLEGAGRRAKIQAIRDSPPDFRCPDCGERLGIIDIIEDHEGVMDHKAWECKNRHLVRTSLIRGKIG